MALPLPGTRPHRSAPTAPPHTGATPRLAPAYAELPPTVGLALDAMRLEALLGDPADPANPYGWPALHHRPHRTPPAPPAAHTATTRPAGPRRRPGADQYARLLRPLYRRDLALAHAWSAPGAAAAYGRGPAAALLAPAGLLATTGTVLRLAARAVDAGPHAAAQWQPVLAAAFADLLACETLTATALRAATAPATRTQTTLADAAGYLVPSLAGEVLEDLHLVLGETTPPAGGAAHTLPAKITEDRTATGTGPAAAAACQARLVTALTGPIHPPHPPQPAPGTLFHLADPRPPALAAGTDAHHTVTAALPAAAAPPDPATSHTSGDPAAAALTRTARRLATEQRLLHQPATPRTHDPADPAARALADRHALLLTAATVLGVHRAAAAARTRFLGEPHWALLALSRITERLATPLPGPLPAVHTGVWNELLTRTRHGVDCDVYATRMLW
ncbi:hypothetical protein ACWDTR_33495 [Streptomyces sp. NPDC003470]|uniref:hypothetical protein n=1 Tax=unclassified Streptomyces TaxID=2593676 RepID=UPI003648E1A2